MELKSTDTDPVRALESELSVEVVVCEEAGQAQAKK